MSILLCGNGAVFAQSANDFYKMGMQARAEQKFVLAIENFQHVLQKEPQNVDALVQLGFSQLADGRDAEAKISFERVLVLTPNYEDARYGLARIASNAGQIELARGLLNTVMIAQPENVDAQNLFQQLNTPVQNWRLDTGTEFSLLTGGRASWSDVFVAASYNFQQGTILSAKSRFVTRGNSSDRQVQLRVDHRFSSSFSAYSLVAVTPEANFLADYSLGGGVSWRIAEGSALIGPIFFTLDGRHDGYTSSTSTTLNPGIQFYLAEGRLAISARWLHSQDHIGTTADGYAVRLDVLPADNWGVSMGYSFAPEISMGRIDETNTIFASAWMNLTDDLVLRANYARERRQAFNRDSMGLGLTVKF